MGPGNNGELVKRVMETRKNYWIEQANENVFLNFKFKQNNKTYKYDRLNSIPNQKQLLNHFEFHKEISNKALLIRNLSFYCEVKNFLDI